MEYLPAMLAKTAQALSLRWIGVVFVCLAGCSGNLTLVPVEGHVTLDGAPLEGASVLFRPTQGRPAVGVTDQAGLYRLRYSRERLGTLPGLHTVQITTTRESEDERPTDARERLPARYNAKTTLMVKVTTCSPKHDFALESQ